MITISQILNQQPGNVFSQCLLHLGTSDEISFSAYFAGRIEAPFRSGQWTHVAGVMTIADQPGGESSLKLYIDGELAGEGTFKRESERGFPKMLGIGTYLQADKGDSFQGLIDAIAVSPEALEPAQFVLPFPTR